MAKNAIELYGSEGLAVRAATAQVSDTFELGADGYATGLLSVTNGLDQNVTVTVQGMNDGDSTWQTDGTVAVVAGATGSYTVTTPWGLVRLSTLPAGIPTTGTLQVRATRLVASAATAAGGAVSTTITDITGFATVAGQATMANSLPVVVASDQSSIDVDVTGIAAVGGAAGQAAMAASFPVVIASDQSATAMKRVSSTTTLTIGNGANLSDELDFTEHTMLIVHMPSAWTAASIGFHVAHTSGGTFQPLYDDLGNLVQIAGPPVASRDYQAPPELAGCRYVKLWSQNGSGTNTNQGAARTMAVSLKA
jgi:hypothetical protein